MAAPWLLESGLSAAIKEDPEFLSKCSSLAADVEGRTIALVTLVERLGGVLTDLDSEIRERGTRILALVLEKIARDFLNEAELQFISSFFSDRLVDQQLVIPAVLQGILAISDMTNLGREQMCRILQAMFRHIHCQTQIHSDRKKYYLIIRCFLYRATEEVQAMGPDFVFGFLSAMDGERDPRNLLLLFGLLPELLALCPPGHLTEDMFEVVACYFPIDFQSASADPDTVTRDDLATALVSALTAVPGFAAYCLPLLFEKLDSSLRLAKTDSLHALRASFETFPASVLNTHVPDAWRALKLEALPGADAELRALALTALRALVAKLSVDSEQRLDSLLDDIVAAGRDGLRQVDLSLFPPSVCLVTATASASAAACACISARVLPMLLAQCGTEVRPQPKTQVLRAITGLLSVCAGFHAAPPDAAAAMELCLACGCSEGADNAELRAESFRGLSALLPFLADVQRETLYAALADRAHDEDATNARQELCMCAASVAALHPSEVSALVRSRLPVRGAPSTSEAVLRRRVQLRCAVATLPELTVDAAADVVDLVTEGETAGQCRVGVQALGELALSESPRVQSALFAECGCVRKLTAWWVRGVRSDSTPAVFADLALLNDTARLLYRVLRTQPHGVQSAVLSELLPQFAEHGSDSFQPLSVTSPPLQTRCLLLLEAIVGALRKEVPLSALLVLGPRLVALITDGADDVTRETAARLVALVVNKAAPSEQLEALVNACFECRSRAVMAGWLTKALLLRGHPRAAESFTALMALLDGADNGVEAAAAFAVLLADGGDFLDTPSHCNVRPLYKQRVFTTALGLAPRARAASDAVKPNYHIVLAHVLRNTPRNILVVDIAQTVSLLVECLQAEEQGLVHATLDTLAALAESAQPLLADHLSTLVPRCLKLAQSHLAMKVRIASLECLYHFTKYPTIVLLPYKPEIVRGLAASVDDRKRLVRRAAVQARTRWFLVGAPGEPSAD